MTNSQVFHKWCLHAVNESCERRWISGELEPSEAHLFDVSEDIKRAHGGMRIPKLKPISKFNLRSYFLSRSIFLSLEYLAAFSKDISIATDSVNIIRFFDYCCRSF